MYEKTGFAGDCKASGENVEGLRQETFVGFLAFLT